MRTTTGPLPSSPFFFFPFFSFYLHSRPLVKRGAGASLLSHAMRTTTGSPTSSPCMCPRTLTFFFLFFVFLFSFSLFCIDDGRRLSSVSRYADDYWISNLLTLTRSRVFQVEKKRRKKEPSERNRALIEP